jgi:FkbM family methyltransferase
LAGVTHDIQARKGHRKRLGRVVITLRALWESLTFGVRRLAWRSFPGWIVDVFHYRLLRVLPLGEGRRRSIRLKDGTQLNYEMNRGDLRVLAEVWVRGAYRLPAEVKSGGTILDIGANIGLTSVWLAKTYGCSHMIGVEPSPRNAAIARLNFVANAVPGSVIEAAVGREDGEALFDEQRDSALGQLGTSGRKVQTISMASVLDRLPDTERIALLKVDIEGGEAEMFCGEIDWLDRVECIVAEVHPDHVDADGFVRRIEQAGFRYQYLDTANPTYGAFGPEFVGLFTRERELPTREDLT